MDWLAFLAFTADWRQPTLRNPRHDHLPMQLAVPSVCDGPSFLAVPWLCSCQVTCQFDQSYVQVVITSHTTTNVTCSVAEPGSTQWGAAAQASKHTGTSSCGTHPQIMLKLCDEWVNSEPHCRCKTSKQQYQIRGGRYEPKSQAKHYLTDLAS
jgi:hypothetical protein